MRRVRLLGVSRPLRFDQKDQALVVTLPDRLPSRHASALEIEFARR